MVISTKRPLVLKMDLSSPQLIDIPENLDLAVTTFSGRGRGKEAKIKSEKPSSRPLNLQSSSYRRSNLFSLPNPDDDPFDLASVSSRGSGTSSTSAATPNVGLLVQIESTSSSSSSRDDVFYSNKKREDPSAALENWELLKCEAQSLVGDLKKVRSWLNLGFLT